MPDSAEIEDIEKLPTGIEGLDHISHGGLPKGRSTLIAGTAGSTKTIFAAQFLIEGIRKYNQPGVFVTFEEQPEDIRKNLLGLGFDVAKKEAAGMWAFVDGSPESVGETMFTGTFDLGGLLSRIENAVRKTNAERVALDSLGPLFTQLPDAGVVRGELYRIARAMRDLNVTAIITAERTEEYGEIAQFGVEEFVADNVIILRNVLEDEKRRRTIELLKFRGTHHNKGEYPFTVLPEEGIRIIPLSQMSLTQKSTDVRVTSGVVELDSMCEGGFLRDSVVLVSGATGTGKTLLVSEFMGGGAERNEKCLLFAFEESPEQLMRNATGWGIDYAEMERKGLLKIVCTYPETQGLEDHLVAIKQAIDEFKPDRLAVDSLSALERVSTPKGYREFVIGLTSFIKQDQITALLTATTPTLTGGSSITEAHISTITDSIILLRYVEIHGVVRRGLVVLKMRGSFHDKDIREFTIDGNGMHVGAPFRNVVGILAGNPQNIAESEYDRIEELFEK